MTREQSCTVRTLRALEMLWRVRGGFDAADFCRQSADCIESGGSHLPPPAKLRYEIEHARDGSDRS